MSETKYRIEFNEEQQKFHLDNGTGKLNSHGWFTVMDEATNKQFHVFESFVNRTNKSRLTRDYLLNCVTEFGGFLKNLNEYGYKIQ